MRGSTWARWIVVALVIVVGSVADAAGSKVLDIVVHGASLEGNLLGNNPDRGVAVVLPPGYDEHPDARYPVLYLLSAYAASYLGWVSGGDPYNLNVASVADDLIANGRIQPLIMVIPNSRNRYGGSFYTNSPVTGRWEDFIAEDLVAYVDTHYRTVARPDARAIVGHGMGGFGALVLAMKRPDVFSVVYAMSPEAVNPVDAGTGSDFSADAILSTRDLVSRGLLPLSPGKMSTKTQLALAAAFSPDAKAPPAYVDFPYKRVDGQPHRVDAVWTRWVAHTPMGMLQDHGPNLLLERGVALDVASGIPNPDYVSGARAFSDALTQLGIPHQFETYEGTMRAGVASQFERVVLPFVSSHLAVP